ncbi:nucleoside/nucleotide kinase family protein [Rhodoferax bucti]|uniref:nucleoside/nucleotide kinase family protein n=1 Tax=Rhodoferax bucti TaxID=2576305 RepID=UPI0011096AD0|nr:nucleoside/nucleotide kinase family protein [Rhodoferax bucti]
MENPNPAANISTPTTTSPPTVTLPAEALARVEALLAQGRRVILGIAAGPGAGKSTLAQTLQQHFSTRSQYLPMDGFHLANRELERLGLRHCKGAPQTFDSAGYVHLLQRIRAQQAGDTVYAPDFDRTLEESIAGSISVHADKPLVITEGNYLLMDEGPWAGVRALLDEAWYLDLDPGVRHTRLLERHMRYGRSEQAARDWIASTDEPNAVRINATQHRADWVLPSF